MKSEYPEGKRIVICTSEFPPGPGGIGVHAYQLALFLSENDYSLTIQAASRDGFNSTKVDKSLPFLIKRYQANKGLGYRIINSFRFLLSIRKQADWVILSGSNQLLLTFLVKVISPAKTLIVIHGHEILMVTGIRKRILLSSLKLANKVVAVSEFSKKTLLQSGFNKPVSVIPNGISYKEFRGHDQVKGDSSSNGLILITVGSLTKRKGQHNVIKALPALLKVYRDVEYHLVGTPAGQQDLEELADQLEVKSYLRFHGVVNDSEKIRLLSLADIFIMLSENRPDGDVEGFGIAILEANQFGIPAIGSKSTGIEQAIKNNASGVLVNAKNESEIVRAVIEIKDNYQKYSMGSIEWAKKHDWKVVGEMYKKTMN